MMFFTKIKKSSIFSRFLFATEFSEASLGLSSASSPPSFSAIYLIFMRPTPGCFSVVLPAFSPLSQLAGRAFRALVPASFATPFYL
jgi:hypothetical protein